MNRILQNQFSGAVRGNGLPNSPRFDEKKIKLYQSLLLNNLIEVTRPCFPILRSILPDKRWRNCLEKFLKEAAVPSPIFHELPKYLVEYLSNHPINGYPFAAELAHYEWVELELELLASPVFPSTINRLDVLPNRWQLAPSARLLSYQYEVEKIGLSYLPTTSNPTFLIVYQAFDKIEFMKINEQSFQLLTLILNENQAVAKIIKEICKATPQLDSKAITTSALQLLVKLYEARILIQRQT